MNLREIETEGNEQKILYSWGEGVVCGEEGKTWSNDCVRMQVTSLNFHPGPMTTIMVLLETLKQVTTEQTLFPSKYIVTSGVSWDFPIFAL